MPLWDADVDKSLACCTTMLVPRYGLLTSNFLCVSMEMLVGGQEASIDVTHTVHSPERLLIGIFDPVNLTND